MNRTACAFAALLILLAAPRPAQAKWIWSTDTGLVDTKDYESADPQELYERGKNLYDQGKYDDAATEFSRISLYASEETFRERAGFMHGEALFQSGKYYKSYVAYDDYLTLWPRTPRLKEVIKRQLDIGIKMMDGAKKDLLGVPILSGRSTGVEILRKVLDKYPFEDFSVEYHWTLVNKLQEAGQHEDAALESEALLERYPDSAFAPGALFLKGQAELSGFAGSDYDPRPLDNAKRTFQDYVHQNPNGDKLGEAQARLAEIAEKEAEQEYGHAVFYLKDVDKPESARVYFESVVENYPGTAWAVKAREQLARLGGGPR